MAKRGRPREENRMSGGKRAKTRLEEVGQMKGGRERIEIKRKR